MSLEDEVVALLKDQGLTLTTAESCTAGLLAGRVMNVAGASAVYEEGYITYSNKAKEKLLGVCHDTLERYGAVSRETACEMAEGAAKAAGADAALVVTPYYNKATQNGLIAHYTDIAKHIDLPIILYNVPSRTGCKLEAATIAKLVKDVDNIVGVKEATGDIAFATQIMYDTQGDIDMYSGNDDMIVPMLSIGGKGVISVLSNVAPEDTHNICAEYFAGNVEKSRELQIKYLELIHSLFCEVNPIPVKKALELMGFYGGNVRLPLTQLEPAHTERLKKAMIETGILA